MVTDRTVIAANRFGLGARPGEVAKIGGEPEGWLLAQLRAPRADAASLPGSRDILVELQGLRRARAGLRGSDVRRQAAAEAFRRSLRGHFLAQATHRYRQAAVAEAPFKERLVHFWANHFAVSADKQPLAALAGTLEAEAIRPHVTGRFVDMLTAVTKHPAMILYLDNQASMGPASRMARAASRRGRDLGLNENLAREILELHTVGVDGGYDQADVAAFARVLTGWSVGGGQGPLASGPSGAFFFRADMHEPGAQAVLGRAYRQGGVAQGEAVLADLAVQPATATFLATKLARHFAGDEPPPALVERLARAYLDTGGALLPVYETLVGSPEPWARPLIKYKTPQDFVLSTYRALGHRPENPERMVAFLEALGQRPFTPGSPAGWPDTASRWDGGEALIRRIEWGRAVGQRVGDRVNPRDLATDLLGPLLSERTRVAIAGAESAAQGLTLLLASPEFQRR